jgi:hypothetical protein
MLEFFRRHQRYIFIFVTAIIIASFLFFGTFSTFGGEEERVEQVIGHAVDGSPIYLSEVQRLSHFLATDRDDVPQRGAPSNLFNNGVVRNDFIQTGLASLLYSAYFDSLKEGLADRLDKVKRYRPYAHPEAPHISAQAIWDRFVPGMSEEIRSLQKEGEVTPQTFAQLAQIYQQQQNLHPEIVRKILVYQNQQGQGIRFDNRLPQMDLSLFGFHTLSDWFGKDFLDLVAQFILNASVVAEEKGYRVTLEEAKGDLRHIFQEAAEQAKGNLPFSYQQHLQMLGFNEKLAAQTWRKVLLFRRFFQDVGEATFIDPLTYKGFAEYALESAQVKKYEWPLTIKNVNDLFAFQMYLKAVCPPPKDPLALPKEFLTPEEVADNYPELVQATYRAKVSQLSKNQVGLRASLKELWDWQVEEGHWATLKKNFSFLPAAETREQRFKQLEKLDPSMRSQVDVFSRNLLVDENPIWIEEAFLAQEAKEKTFGVSAAGVQLSGIEQAKQCTLYLQHAIENDPLALAALRCYSNDGSTFYRFEGVERLSEPQILLFEKARGVLSRLVDQHLQAEYPKVRKRSPEKFQTAEGEWKQFAAVKEEVGLLVFADVIQAIDRLEKQPDAAHSAARRFLAPTQEAYASLQKNPSDSFWLRGSGDPLLEQFKLVSKELLVQRTSKEDWMKEQAFLLVPNQWSPIYVPDDGQIVFFYLLEKKPHETPILEQLSFGKATLSADAQRYLGERLIETAQKKQAIVIPVEKEVQ